MSDLNETNPAIKTLSQPLQDFSRPPRIKEVLAFALPMMISQAAETVMLFTDRLFLSFLGKHHIAASMSGSLSSFVFSSFFLGMIGFVNVLSAQYHGAGRGRKAMETCVQGLWLAVFCYPLALGLIPLVQAGFHWAGHDPAQIVLESSYFRLLMLGSILGFFRAALSGYFLGTGRTRIVMIANGAGMLANLPLGWLLIFGTRSLGGTWEGMGIEGAALATIGGSAVIFIILALAWLRTPEWKALARGLERRLLLALRPDILRRLLRFGTPAGVEQFLNVFAFNVFLQLMHSYGADTAAAVTITFNYDLVSFIPLTGIGVSVSAMVGQRMGAGFPDAARRTAWLSLRIALTYSGLMVLLFVLGAPFLVQAFAGGLGAGDSQILDQAALMLRLASLYLLADAVQLIFSGALRGAGDTKWVMLAGGSLHYLMAAGAFVGILVFRLPPLAVWAWFIGFIMCLSLTMFLRYSSGKWKGIQVIEPDYTH